MCNFTLNGIKLSQSEGADSHEVVSQGGDGFFHYSKLMSPGEGCVGQDEFTLVCDFLDSS